MIPEVIPASRTKGDIIGYSDNDDTESMGSDASFKHSEGDDEQVEFPHLPPEVVEEVFSSMTDSMSITKEEVMDWCSDADDVEGEEEHVHSNSKVQKLPKTAKELYNRFKLLVTLPIFMIGKHGNRNDLIFTRCNAKVQIYNARRL